jgi:hypothetical protein
MSEWQPIETAPKDGTPVLAFIGDGDGAAVLGWSAGCREWQDYNGSSPRYDPTHWMPLPPPPPAGEVR